MFLSKILSRSYRGFLVASFVVALGVPVILLAVSDAPSGRGEPDPPPPPEVDTQINGLAGLKVNGESSIEGTLPLKVNFTIEEGAGFIPDEYLLTTTRGSLLNGYERVQVPPQIRLAGYGGNLQRPPSQMYYMEFGDGEDLNPNNCRRIDDTYEYKDLICNQPLVSAYIDTGETVGHTYVYDKVFTVKLYQYTHSRLEGRDDQRFDYYRLVDVATVIANLPEVSLQGAPLDGASGENRNLAISCPTMFELSYIEVQGDRTSILNSNLELRGNKLFYTGILEHVKELNVQLNPTSDTTLTVACRPNGLTDDMFNKYLRYQRYFTYDIPDTPNITKSITFSVSDMCTDTARTYCSGDNVVSIDQFCEETVTPCQYGCTDGKCNDEPTTCEPVNYCLGNNVIYIDEFCERTTEECRYGCTNGECNDDTCVPSLYCQDKSLVSRSADCELKIVEICAYECTLDGCVDERDPMVVIANLVARPGIVVKGGISRISWEVENAESCSVNGTNGDLWTTQVGDYDSSPLEQTTDYTLLCTDFDGRTIEQSVTVRIAPTWQEL